MRVAGTRAAEIARPVSPDERGALPGGALRGFAMFDALMVATDLRARSTTLWSEDMEDGMVIEGALRIANPFRP